MFYRFKPVPAYIKFYMDKVEISRLDNGQKISRTAKVKFSNGRLVVADFNIALELAQEVLSELIPPFFFLSPTLIIIIQQMEKLDGELSSVEKRALMDLGEHCGGKTVIVIEGTAELTQSQALSKLKEKQF